MSTNKPGKNPEIEKLTIILSNLQNLYYKKKEQLIELEDEISALKTTIDNLNSIISSKSFHSAAELYSESEKVQEVEKKSEERYFIENIPQEQVSGTKIKRKIFLQKEEEEELICILNLYDMDELEIKILQPQKYKLQETSENFIALFLKEALIKIKERTPNMELNYEYLKNTNIIEKIVIKNLKSIKDFDLITEKLRDLFSRY
ncbi:MAG: hypothetical protein EU547_06150 [Promethearchaeota archaeon]|nr:MAG: hypothetical protein EU547_06150 [Candidatus Lokiarchaeota archaeon]